jgi:hypothetical protein
MKHMPFAGIAIAAAAVVAFGQAACAAPTVPEQQIRLIVKTAKPSPGDAAESMIRQVSASAQVPAGAVKYVAASGGDWHAVTVQCGNTARCDDVVARLQADTTHFSSVALDEPRKAHQRSAQ